MDAFECWAIGFILYLCLRLSRRLYFTNSVVLSVSGSHHKGMPYLPSVS
jgi:hypothetical protein